MKYLIVFYFLCFIFSSSFAQEDGGNYIKVKMGKSSANMSTEELTGLTASDIFIISEGLRNEMLRYRSELGGEDDVLFKIITKAYYRSLYPLLFKAK